VPRGCFQYPVSDRMGCNEQARGERQNRPNFQYPVSDRMGCNSTPACRPGKPTTLSVSCVGSNGLQPVSGNRLPFSLRPFSILCRIEWAATFTSFASSMPLKPFFQYPVSDRMGCNGLTRVILSRCNTLSVSCVGSNGLQPWQVSYTLGCSAKLSVSCVGSNGLQHPSTAGRRDTARSFQYPVSDRMGCNNSRRVWTCPSTVSFQYPVSDRMGCN